MDDQDPTELVYVATHSVAALSQPTFLIEVEGKYYATLAVWEYDHDAPCLTEEQHRFITRLADDYRERRERGPHFGAVKIDPRILLGGVQSKPER